MSETAIRRATVVVDCTPKGIGHANKMKYYTMYENEVTGFIAQGSESEFGKPFAFGINEKAITPDDKYIQVVSCNTHNIAVVIKAFHPGNLVAGRFVCIRRANDISQVTKFIPGVEVGEHACSLGTHQALDVRELYRTIGYDLNVWSSAMKVSTQYMHSIHFILTLAYGINEEEAIETFRNQPRVAVTNKMNSCEVFSFGRDHGHYGRILSQAIVVLPTIRVIDEHEVVGFCFTPQDGNSLLSSVVALERFLYPDQYLERIKCLDYFLFDEV